MTSKRLARLVRLKRLAEQAQAAELADERRTLESAKGELARVHDAMEATDSSVEVNASPGELAQVAAYQDHLSTEAMKRRLEIAGHAEAVRSREVEVQSAWRDRRLLETVHDRAVDREVVEETARSHKAMEAIALSRYGKGND